MINKYTTEIEISKTTSGKSYYTTLIPSKIPRDTFQFTVVTRMGDRFDNMAARYYKDASKWWIIAKANRMVNGSMFIEPGTRIIIPSVGL